MPSVHCYCISDQVFFSCHGSLEDARAIIRTSVAETGYVLVCCDRLLVSLARVRCACGFSTYRTKQCFCGSQLKYVLIKCLNILKTYYYVQKIHMSIVYFLNLSPSTTLDEETFVASFQTLCTEPAVSSAFPSLVTTVLTLMIFLTLTPLFLPHEVFAMYA